MGGSGVARRAVLVLLGGAFTSVLAGAAWGGEVAGSHVLAQLPAPIIAQAAPSDQQRPRLISLDFKDADINNILRILAEFSGLNIVTSEDVKGRVTVKLQNVPWQQALDSVVRAAKLAYVQEGNIIRVDKLENLTKEAEAAFRAEQLESERRRGAELAKQEREAAQRDRDAAQQERGAAQQEREAAQRDREAALRERASRAGSRPEGTRSRGGPEAARVPAGSADRGGLQAQVRTRRRQEGPAHQLLHRHGLRAGGKGYRGRDQGGNHDHRGNHDPGGGRDPGRTSDHGRVRGNQAGRFALRARHADLRPADQLPDRS